MKPSLCHQQNSFIGESSHPQHPLSLSLFLLLLFLCAFCERNSIVKQSCLRRVVTVFCCLSLLFSAFLLFYSVLCFLSFPFRKIGSIHVRHMLRAGGSRSFRRSYEKCFEFLLASPRDSETRATWRTFNVFCIANR